MDIQKQIENNADDLQKFLLDMNAWEHEMHKKEEELKLAEVSPFEEFPPIRNSSYRSKKKSRHKKVKDKNISTDSTKGITSDDSQALKNYDMDKELQKIDLDGDGEKKETSPSDASDDEEVCLKKRKQLAVLHKDKGNELLKKGNYDSAINSYTTGMQLDPENPLLAANRAMAFLKKEQFQAAENDCTVCLSIDPTYVKAYLRRGTARCKLEKFSLAREDFSKALELEPENKQAQSELKKIEQKIDAFETISEETEVVQSQEFWPKFLGNKTVEHLEHNTAPDSISASSSNDLECIFPDAKLLVPVLNPPDIDEESFIEIPVSNLSEKDFIQKVGLHKATEPKESNKPYNSELDNLINLLELTLPPIPSTAYQFFTDWKTIASNPSLKYQYLKQFPPEKLKVTFRHSMEPELFPDILHTLSTQFLENGDDIVPFLKYLADIGRFSTMLMFLSSQEQKDLNILLDAVKSSNISNQEKEQLLSLYEI